MPAMRIRMRPRRLITASWWWERAPWVWRRPLIWRGRACRSWCSMTMTRSVSAAVPSVLPSARWRLRIVWGWARHWWTRACSGTSARCSSISARSMTSTCCPRMGTSARPSSTCNSIIWKSIWSSARRRWPPRVRRWNCAVATGWRVSPITGIMWACGSTRWTALTRSPPITSSPAMARAARSGRCWGWISWAACSRTIS